VNSRELGRSSSPDRLWPARPLRQGTLAHGRSIRIAEHDIDKDASALGRKIGIDGDKRVPTVVIDGKVIRGYSPSAYQAALERR
jgi:glutaredoxin